MIRINGIFIVAITEITKLGRRRKKN